MERMRKDKRSLYGVGVGLVFVLGGFVCCMMWGNEEKVKGDSVQETIEVQETTELQETAELRETLEVQETEEVQGREKLQEALAIQEDVEEYLWEQVPEMKEYGEYIREVSEGQADLMISVYMDLEAISRDGEKQYYSVYVGESWEDHTVNWDWFYVREDLEEILWYSIIDNIYLSLEEWRSSEYYNSYR